MAEHVEQVAQNVEHVYGAALAELALEAGQLDEIAEEVGQLLLLLREHPELTSLLGSRVLSASERSASIERMFKGQVNDLLYRFIQVINAKGRTDKLVDILDALTEIIEQRQGTVEAEAWVAKELGADQAANLAEKLSAALGRNVVLQQKVDPKLIGGLKLRLGDQLLDGTVATQLKLLKHKIMEQGREKVRGNLAGLVAE